MKRIPIKKIFLISLGLWLAGISGCGDSQVNVTITPRNVTVPTDVTFDFTVEVSNTQELGVTWSIDHNDNGSLGSINSDSGVYTPPPDIPTPNTATIRVTSDADSGASDTVKVTIVSGNTLRFDPNLQVTDYSIPIPTGTPCTPGTNCIASTISSGQHSVQVFSAKHGKYDYTLIYAVWSDNRNGINKYDVYLRQITLKTLVTNPPTSPVITLSNTVQVNNYLTDSSDPANPSLAVDNAGNVYVAWQSDRGPMGVGTLGYHNIYINKGKLAPFKDDAIPNVTFTDPLLFSDSTGPCDKRAPSIAVENSNRVFVAWEDLRTATPSCSADSTIRAAGGSPPQNPPPNPLPPPPPPPTSYPILSAVYLGSGSQTEPSIGFFQSELHVAWTGAQLSCTGICFTQGKTPTSTVTSWSTTAPVLVNDDPGVADHRRPSLVVDSTGGGDNAGNVYVVWQDNRNGVYYDIFFAKKEKDEDNFDGATDQNNTTEHNIRVNDDTVANGFNDTADQQRPSIVVEHSEPNANSHTPNKIYVAWQDNRNYPSGSLIYDIFAAKSLDGGNSFRTNAGPANLPLGNGPAYDPSIAVDTFGRAHLIWTDERNNSGAPGAATDVFFAIGQ